MTESGDGRTAPYRGIDVFLSLSIVFNLAVAQPILDLLGRNAAFFVARDAPPVDLWLLVVGLTLCAPLGLALAVLLVSRLHARTGRILHFFLLAALVAVLASQILRRAPGIDSLPGVVPASLTLVLGAAAGVAVLRSTGLRSILRFGAPIPLLVAGSFLLLSPASKVIFPERAAATAAAVRNPAPVVLVVFDEMPIASLMDEQGGIDATLYPNFARLASDGTWFRNATASHDFTEYALPAILTGRHSKTGTVPIAGEYPRNLFTLLGPRYEVRADEPITDLCPPSLCKNVRKRAPFLSRWKGMAADLRVVFLHMVLPADLARGVPPIDQGWGNFGNAGGGAQERQPGDVPDLFRKAVAKNRQAVFGRFVDSIQSSTRPTLHFLHSMLPHVPWQYLPTRQAYEQAGVPGVTDRNRWTGDEWLPAQAYQRHLLQVGLVDALLGDLIAKLEREGMYDRSLIVVTADHGANFEANQFRRSIGEETIGDIGAVPLFVKRPGEKEGGPVDRPVQLIDVLPTIADVLGVTSLWKTDGVSAFDTTIPPRTRKELRTRVRTIFFDARGREKFDVVARKYRLFARRGRSLDPFRIGPNAGLVGRPTSSLAFGSARRGSVRIDDEKDYQAVDPEASAIPALLRGHAAIAGRGGGYAELAIAVNGVIHATTRTYEDDGERGLFGALLPPGAFRKGRNLVEVFLIERSANARTFHRIRG